MDIHPSDPFLLYPIQYEGFEPSMASKMSTVLFLI